MRGLLRIGFALQSEIRVGFCFGTSILVRFRFGDNIRRDYIQTIGDTAAVARGAAVDSFITCCSDERVHATRRQARCGYLEAATACRAALEATTNYFRIKITSCAPSYSSHSASFPFGVWLDWDPVGVAS